jgi:hypothetical protein
MAGSEQSAIEPEKTELIFIHPLHAKKNLPLNYPSNGNLPPTYRVNPKLTIQYLGFFINHKLNWKSLMEIMCNCAQASIKVLQILGSTHCRLSMANWRLVFNAICLPVLSYGCTLWFKHKCNLGLTKMVQQVINDGVKLITGAFCMAPQEPLHELMRATCIFLPGQTDHHLCPQSLLCSLDISAPTLPQAGLGTTTIRQPALPTRRGRDVPLPTSGANGTCTVPHCTGGSQSEGTCRGTTLQCCGHTPLGGS